MVSTFSSLIRFESSWVWRRSLGGKPKRYMFSCEEDLVLQEQDDLQHQHELKQISYYLLALQTDKLQLNVCNRRSGMLQEPKPKSKPGEEVMKWEVS